MKAVVFIDIQNDFIDGALRNEDAIKKMPKIVDFAERCVDDENIRCYATQDTHAETKYALNTKDSLDPGSELVPVSGYYATLEGQRLQVPHCIRGTNGWKINTDLLVNLAGDCTFVDKPTFGSLTLPDYIDGCDNLDEIILCGFCTDICVVSNALILRARFSNTKITVLEDLCSGTSKEAHDAALKVMQSCMIDIAKSDEI